MVNPTLVTGNIMKTLDRDTVIENARKNAQMWVDAFKPNGNPDREAIMACLEKRTYNGKPVEALLAGTPDEAVGLINDWVDKKLEQIPAGPKRDAAKCEMREQLRNAHNCIWDYYLMAFYESACKDLPNKDFEYAEFIYQSLFPAFEAGLGYLINLGELIVGVCLPEAHMDESGRLHNPHGPALSRWGDDKYFWHGTEVEKEWIESPHTVDPKLFLSISNIEKRRAFCEIIGWNKIVDTLNPEVIDTDPDPQIGTLLQAELPDHGIQKFLRVDEKSTGRQFCILVSDDPKTALDAQAEINQIPADLFKIGYVRT